MNGANGYTLKIEHENVIFSYSHISPNFVVELGDCINKGEVIAHVGPHYLDEDPKNPYKDPTGRPTNGSTTGTHLHLGVKIDGKAIDPIPLFSKQI